MTTPSASPQRNSSAMVIGGVILVFVAVSLLTAPDPPSQDEGWRWITIAVGLGCCIWNINRAIAAVRRVGPVSIVAFLHLWVFLAFSFPAVEMTYRYEQIRLGYWHIWTDDPLLFRVALLLGAFQFVFFLALGHGVDTTCRRLVDASRTWQPRPWLGWIFVVLLLPLVIARVMLFSEIGLSGMATALTARTDYFDQIEGRVSPLQFLLNSSFPVYAVMLGCLAVKFLVKHPSSIGRRLFIGVLVGCVGGVVLSGGRAEIVLIAATVGIFMYVAGYRTAREVMPLLVLGLSLAALLFGVAQARLGVDNVLSRASGGTVVGDAYSSGDISQIHGLGRFEFVVMILDRHQGSDALWGSSYWGAVIAGLQTTFLPKLVLGVDLPVSYVSGDVLGPWVFGGRLVSALPSSPGEAYINFGYTGIMAVAIVLGLITRGLISLAGRLPEPQEVTLVLIVWTMARLISDESALLATFLVRNWPIMVISIIVMRLAKAPENHVAPAPSLVRR